MGSLPSLPGLDADLAEFTHLVRTHPITPKAA